MPWRDKKAALSETAVAEALLSQTNEALEARRERVTILMCATVLPTVCLGFAVVSQLVHENVYTTVFLAIAGVISLFSRSILKHTRLNAVSYISTLITILILAISVFRNGYRTPSLLWLFLPLILNLAVLRVRAAIGFGSFGLLGVFLMWLAEATGLFIPAEGIPATGVFITSLIFGVALTLVIFLQSYWRLRDDESRLLMGIRLARANKLTSVARLASSVAHDFNNLLTVISSQTQVLSESATSAQVESLLAIQHASNAGAALTKQLLAIGRKRQTSNITLVDINAVCARVASLVRTLLPANITTSFESLETAAFALGDEWAIHQAVMNLCINSKDALASGGSILIRVDVQELEEETLMRFGPAPPGEYVRISVEDSGVGMPEEVMNQVVEPFFTTRSDDGGTGLGLSIVHGVAAAMGGQLDIKSKVGEGTVVRVFFPRAEAPSFAEDDESPETEIRPAFSKILLVDDDSAVLRSVARVIGAEGHAVTTASSLGEARTLFRPGEFQVLMVDRNLPDGIGSELALELHEVDEHLALVLMTGSLETEEEIWPHSEIPAELVRKPASQKLLRGALLRALGQRVSLEPSRAGAPSGVSESVTSADAKNNDPTE